jgi:hypothetical protein
MGKDGGRAGLPPPTLLFLERVDSFDDVSAAVPPCEQPGK